jgi:hypothetical protein
MATRKKIQISIETDRVVIRRKLSTRPGCQECVCETDAELTGITDRMLRHLRDGPRVASFQSPDYLESLVKSKGSRDYEPLCASMRH